MFKKIKGVIKKPSSAAVSSVGSEGESPDVSSTNAAAAASSSSITAGGEGVDGSSSHPHREESKGGTTLLSTKKSNSSLSSSRQNEETDEERRERKVRQKALAASVATVAEGGMDKDQLTKMKESKSRKIIIRRLLNIIVKKI